MAVPARPPDPALIVPRTYPEARAHESRARLRGPAYRRPTWNVYVAADLARATPGTSNGDHLSPRSRGAPLLDRRFDHHGEAIAVFRAALGPTAVLSGPSAAWALGIRLARSDDPVEIALPPDRRLRSRRGLRVHGDLLLPGETVATPFGLATSPARTAFDLSRRDTPDRALGWVDAVLRETGARVSELQQLIATHPGSRGVRHARTLAALADPRAESPRESMLRWMLLNAGLPAPTPQLVVQDLRGRFVARLDLGWEAVKVGAEYDGSHHRERTQHSRDLARHNKLRALGWTVI